MASYYVDDYHDDGYDDDYEVDKYGEPVSVGDVGDAEDELSPEDQVAMATGSAEVRKALGKDAFKVTNTQIQDALWHYYYDVDKSVAYLNRTYIAPPPPKPAPTPRKAPEGMLSHSKSFFAAHCLFSGPGMDHQGFAGAGNDKLGPGLLSIAINSYPILEPPQLSPRAYFNDMPWLNTPQDRQTVFIAPDRPRGGLLGGAEGEGAPMTKLQKLAAARRKKVDEKKYEQNQAGKAAQGLSIDCLSLSQKENKNPMLQSKRQKVSFEEGDQKQDSALQGPAVSLEPRDKPYGELAADLATADQQNSTEELWAEPNVAAPSAFTRVFCGLGPQLPQAPRPDVLPMPYTSSPLYNAAAFDEPSPDDIVLAAQAQAGKKNPLQPKTAKSTKKSEKSEKSSDGSEDTEATTGVSNLNIGDVPPPKSKGLDVVKEFENSPGKRGASFVVVGHVDAGKSTLMGRLLVELKHVEQRTVDKYQRQAEKVGKKSFALAWVMDQGSEERDRGVTIDIATNHFETDKTKFTILDAPGHRDFVPNMIAGASQADFAILVIDANTGEYERGLKGQTREHVLLLRSMGVQRLIVAVNKLDMVGYSQDRYDEISQEVTGFLGGLGFQDKHVSFIPISGLNGDNIVRPLEHKAASWYIGATLIDALEASVPSNPRALRKPLRMPISEVFRSLQGTTTLSGRIESGTMQVGDVLVVQPSGETAHIKSIVVDTENQDWAVAGQNVSLALMNIDPVHLKVGDILCHPTDAIPIGDSFTMKAMAFEHLLPSPVDLHRGRLHAPGRIQSIMATLDKATGQIIKKKPKIVQPGGVARVVIKLESSVPLEAGQRVVIRSRGETIAAGLVE